MKDQYRDPIMAPVPVNTVKNTAKYQNVTYRYRRLSTKQLRVDPLYQRPLQNARVKKMVQEYNPCLVNAVKVSFRDGKYYIFDGAHTVEMLKELNGGRDCVVECKVFEGLSWYDEVELFIAQNGLNRAVHMSAKFKAMFNSGDKDVVGMVHAAERLNIRIDFTGRPGQDKIVALTTLFRIYKCLDEAEFSDLLGIIKEAWGGSMESFSNEILRGMHLFYEVYRGQYNRKLLVSKLSKVSPNVIIREGKASTTPGNYKYAREILKIYNAGITQGKRLPDKL